MPKFDSEAFYERLLTFGQKCQNLVSKLPLTVYNNEFGKQLIRSSSSPGANYIEALESLSQKDFTHRLRICRKESRESGHWLRLIYEANHSIQEISNQAKPLIIESRELVKILTASILTLEKKNLSIR